MKNLLSILAFISLFGCATQVQAQYITIPDANFRTFLQQQYPACFNAQGKMDTTCTAITTATQMICDNRNIADLTGVQYFDGLQDLRCFQNALTTLPRLPVNLTILNCHSNQLISLPNLPTTLIELHCRANFIAVLPLLPNGLGVLDCGVNSFGQLPQQLPPNLGVLDCSGLYLAQLPALPNTIEYLFVGFNGLLALPSLPTGLRYLEAGDNPGITCLPTLPLTLEWLYVPNTQITCIPNYTNNITAANAAFPLCIPNTCLPTLCDGSGLDCVFPGDTNHDGICNNFDVLPISVLDGQAGTARANATTNWYGQPSTNWNTTIPNTAFDAKFADANGSALIDSVDINAVYTNYNRTNNGTIPTNRGINSTNAVFPIKVVFTRDTFNIGLSDTITADIFVGSTALAATNFYGFAASITYDSTLFKPLSIQYNNASFMGNDQQVNVFGINNVPAQKYDIALARRTHTNIQDKAK
jgi:hypothetical protein